MSRALRGLAWLAAVLLGLPLVVVLLAVVLLNTSLGRSQVERLTAQLTAGQVAISGLSGRFPDALRLDHAEIRDARGAWLLLDGVALDWSPSRLLRREAQVDTLVAERVQVLRLPEAAPGAPAASADTGPFTLPVRVSVAALRIARADVAVPVAGTAAILALSGSAHVASLQDGDVDVVVDRLDAGGSYAVQGRIDPQRISARLRLNEPPGGLVAGLAGLPDLGSVVLRAALDGPRSAEVADVALSAGALTATAKGVLNLEASAADLAVAAQAPAMRPAEGVAWQAVALDAIVHGPFTAPDVAGTVTISGLQAAGVAFDRLAAEIHGNQGAAGLRASIAGLRLPGPQPDLLVAEPVSLQADTRLDDPRRPVTFTLTHKLVQARGSAQTAGGIAAHADITLPDLAPLAAAGGVDLAGRSQLAVGLAIAGATTTVEMDGTVAVSAGQKPIPGLLGEATLGLSLALTGDDIAISRAQIDGKTLHLAVTGSDKAGVLDLATRVALTDLAVLAPTVSGAITAQGTAKGPASDLAVDAELNGEVGALGVPRGPLAVSVHATGLPSTPAGRVVAHGTLQGAPLELDIHAEQAADGVLQARIDRADWKTLHAEGAGSLARGAALPQGALRLAIARLDDLRPFVGQPLSGAVTAEAQVDAAAATLSLEATHAGLPGSQVGRARLAARVSDPLGRPDVTATLDAEGIQAGGIGGSAKLAVAGPKNALAIRLTAALTNVAGADATIAGAGTLDAPASTVQLTSLSAAWQGQALRLLTPARVSYGAGLTVDRLRLGVQQAVLDVAGRVTPALNLTAALTGVTPDLAKPFVPGLDAAGQISADARLTGTPAAPQGTVHLAAQGVRLRSGPARALPAADLTATAQLAGGAATVDARLVAGRSSLALAGRAPLGPGALALRATGGVELAMLDPILAPDGRRARGRLSLDATVAGTLAAPLVNGSLVLAGGEVQDFTQGIHLTDVAATLQATGQTVRIASLSGRAGDGSITGGGSVGLQAPMPVDITLALRGARALASDRLTADIDADLALRGDLAGAGALAATGKIAIQRATINIPQHLPASVAVLNVRLAGKPPAPPPKPGTVVRLDLALDTPGQIFVRGRGLDAVLGGSLRVGGTSSAPQITGGFEMRRGTFSLAGTTLTFSRGKVGFDGAGTTDKIDPSLDFEADSVTSNVTAMLMVGGYASAPKITLASSPTLPQDEVLAQLLFGRSAKELGPFQYAEIAAALADLSGTTSVGNPLDRVRKGLGLDRLSVGGGAAGGSGGSTAATVEAGRYVANGVYVGAKQGTTGAQSQATVEIDLFKGLKAVTDVGSGAGGNSVGLSYQFDY